MSGRWKRADKQMQSNYLAPDGFHYGVMFDDGSVMEAWSGRTQRDRAQEFATKMATLSFPDLITLARRTSGGEWERCQHVESGYVHESWWWVQHDKPARSSVSGEKKWVIAQQKKHGGRIEVYRTTNRSTTFIRDVTP